MKRVYWMINGRKFYIKVNGTDQFFPRYARKVAKRCSSSFRHCFIEDVED